jgi:hypothetical protein
MYINTRCQLQNRIFHNGKIDDEFNVTYVITKMTFEFQEERTSRIQKTDVEGEVVQMTCDPCPRKVCNVKLRHLKGPLGWDF